MNSRGAPEIATRLEREIFTHIPLAAAMRVRVADHRPGRLVLTAPFDVNRNHEGTTFGGSIECLATLAGWGLLWLMLANPETTIMISHVETRFRAPFAGELRATAAAPAVADWDRFATLLARRGRAGIDIAVSVGSKENSACAEFRGRYGVMTKAARSSAEASTPKRRTA
ncbi:MAG: YiiD C-terminal domain-containing protein [Gammaproteobacteria bacterium]